MNEVKKVVRFKNGVKNEILEFVNIQKNFSETITFLIEKEIFENGIRNLVEHIPIVRTNEYLSKLTYFKKTTQTVKKPDITDKINIKDNLSFKGYEE